MKLTPATATCLLVNLLTEKRTWLNIDTEIDNLANLHSALAKMVDDCEPETISQVYCLVCGSWLNVNPASKLSPSRAVVGSCPCCLGKLPEPIFVTVPKHVNYLGHYPAKVQNMVRYQLLTRGWTVLNS